MSITNGETQMKNLMDEATYARANVDTALDDASERGGAMLDAAQDAAYSIEESLEEVIAQRPLATVGLALGLGFIIGMTWRR